MSSLLTVDARWACLTFEHMRERGVRTDTALKEAGLVRSQLRDPDKRIPFRKHVRFMEIAAERLEDPFWGLHLGASVHPKQGGLLGYVALSSDTLGEALSNLTRYLSVLSEGAEAELVIQGNRATVVSRILDPEVLDCRQIDDFGMSILLATCRALTATDVRPERVDFRTPTPPALDEHRRVFGSPVRFDQPRSGLVLHGAAMDLPVKTADSGLLKILERYCREILGRRPAVQSLVYQVRVLIAHLLISGEPTIDSVARELNLSSRTLERRLSAQGLTYRRVLDDLRRQLAERYLADERLGLAQITYLLGYSEPTAFNRAFRRWTASGRSTTRGSASGRAPACRSRRTSSTTRCSSPAGSSRSRRTSSRPTGTRRRGSPSRDSSSTTTSRR
jgi:AraC-like DNA-binding protein